MIISDKIIQLSDMTESALEDNDIPEYSGKATVQINENISYWTAEEFEKYSELDDLERCGVANICEAVMSTEERGEIGMIKPTGWHTVKYPDVIEDRYLYNRCHLIGYQLAGENTNEKNLIIETRYLNVEGMLPYENEVASYVRKTDNHVMYRVTSLFEGNNLVASGVLMEVCSVEDFEDGICFCVYAYNV